MPWIRLVGAFRDSKSRRSVMAVCRLPARVKNTTDDSCFTLSAALMPQPISPRQAGFFPWYPLVATDLPGEKKSRDFFFGLLSVRSSSVGPIESYRSHGRAASLWAVSRPGIDPETAELEHLIGQ